MASRPCKHQLRPPPKTIWKLGAIQKLLDWPYLAVYWQASLVFVQLGRGSWCVGKVSQESATTAKLSSRCISFARITPPSHLVEALTLMEDSKYGKLHSQQYQAWHGVLAFYRLIRRMAQARPQVPGGIVGLLEGSLREFAFLEWPYMHLQGTGVSCDRVNVGHTIILMTDENVSRPCSGSGSYCVMNRELLELTYSTHISEDYSMATLGPRRSCTTSLLKRGANNLDGRRLRWHKAKCSHLERAFSFFLLFLQLSRPGQFSLVMSVMLV